MCYNLFYHFNTYIFDGKVMLALSFILIVDFLAGSKQIKSLFVIRVLYVFVSFSLRSLTRWSLDWQPWNRIFFIKTSLNMSKLQAWANFSKFLIYLLRVKTPQHKLQKLELKWKGDKQIFQQSRQCNEYRHSSTSVVSITVIFDLLRLIILSYFPPL